MNYHLIYNQLIAKRKATPATIEEYEYVECHHIVPKSEGGSNDKSNLVYLTAREHYIAHMLLTKIYHSVGMYYAYVLMCKGKNKGTKRMFHINSRLYEKLKKHRNIM